MIIGQGDRFLAGTTAPGSCRLAAARIAGAVGAAIVLHGCLALGVGCLEAPASRPAPALQIPIEVVLETAMPEPMPRPPPPSPGGQEEQSPAAGAAAPGRFAPTVVAEAGSPGSRPRRPASRRGAQHVITARPVPAPADRGDELLRYEIIVLDRLERVKRFPKRAALRGARGTSVVGFALDQAGRVEVTALLRSSGDRALDAESLAVIRRAAPFPQPPAGARRMFAVDIAFGTGG